MPTDTAYIQRNLKGFEGDDYLASHISDIVQDYVIETIIETGTYLGGTTLRFADMVNEVITIEADRKNFLQAQKRLGGKWNVKQYYGKSEDVLPGLLKGELIFSNILFFLDAHWGSHCPLKDELKAIANAGIKPVIVIHDFFNPDHPEFGYDTYNGQRLDLEYIEEDISRIYLDGWEYEYNDVAEGAKRGVITFYPYEHEGE